MPLTPDDLARALATRPFVEIPRLPGRTNHRRAGVAVPLRWSDEGVHALLTLRPRTLRRHGGEVSFPGGKPEPDDADLRATALRETHEELGLRRLDVLGRLNSMPVYTSDFRLEPFVVAVDPREPVRPDPGEVERVLTLDVGAMLAAETLEGMETVHQGKTYVMPIFRPDGHVLFGATAITFLELLGVVADVVGGEVPPLVPGPLTWEHLAEHKAHAG